MLTTVGIVDGRSRTVTFRSDVQGQVIRRDEADALSGGDPHEIWYRFAGRQIGYVGNNGSLDIDYAATDVERSYTAGAGAFENGATTSTSYADFDQAVAHINSFYQGSRAGSYTAQAGETFSSIAATLWGDGSLWYKLAQANGASSDEPLTAGEIINIPTGVMRSTNTAATFIPYDPADITGNTSPTAVKPPKNPNNHCGVFGQILLVVIAVAVVALTRIPLTNFFATGSFAGGAAVAAKAGVIATIAGGATAGAVGSVASQAVGVVTGIQDNFSWNAVAMAAIGGGVGASKVGDAFSKAIGVVRGAGQAAVAGAVNNVVMQGIGIAVGAQKSFSWASVAAAGIGAAAGNIASNRLPGAAHNVVVNGKTIKFEATWGNQQGASMAQTLADAGAHSLIDGSDFGDNIMAALPNVIGSAIGQTIGNAIAGKIANGMQEARQRREYEEYQNWRETKAGQVAIAELGDIAARNGLSESDIAGLVPSSGDNDEARFQTIQHSQGDDRDSGSLPERIERARQELEQRIDRASEEVRQRIDEIRGTSEQQARYYATEAAMQNARATITFALDHLEVTPEARRILTDFRDGSGSRERTYSGNNSAEVRQLFTGARGSFYRREVTQSMQYAAVTRGAGTDRPNVANMFTLENGEQLTDYHFADAGVGFFAATIWEGATQRLDMSHAIGTVTDNFVVRDGRVHFEMVNNMSLESYAGQNFFHHDLIINPVSGPFSTITTTFQFSVPNPYAAQRRAG